VSIETQANGGEVFVLEHKNLCKGLGCLQATNDVTLHVMSKGQVDYSAKQEEIKAKEEIKSTDLGI
jgi:hypothetical protein